MKDIEMPRTTISLTKEQMNELKQMAKEGYRPLSQQIVFLMDFYKEHKDKFKK